MLPPLRLRHTKRRRIALSTLSALSGLFLLACAFLTFQAYFRLDDLTAARSDNMQYTISRIEVEYTKLQAAADALGDAPPASSVAVRRRFNALYSRVDTLLSSPLYATALAAQGMRSDLQQIKRTLDALIPAIDGAGGPAAADDGQLAARLAPLSDPVQRISRAALDIGAAQSEAEREALARTLFQLAVISLLLLAALVALLFQLWTLFTRYRKRAVENRTTLRRVRTILNTSLDHILVVDPDDRILEANAAADTAFGLSLPDGGRKPVTGVLFRTNDDGTRETVNGTMLIAACRDGPVRCSKILAMRDDDTVFPVEMSAALAIQSGREVCICYLRDISLRVKSRQEIEAARDRALAGEQAQARFLGMISHEMRTPLNGILGTVDLLEDTTTKAERRRYVRIIQNAGQQLLTQINDALDLTQTGTGRLLLNTARFDLDALLQDAVAGFVPQATATGTRLTVRVPEGLLGYVEGDRARVLQVLVNLISNAVKFTDAGEITVEATRPAHDQPWIEVQVADTGRGIPEDDQPRIFEDFVRASNTSELDAPGTGLGLGISRNLVRAMGGSIGAESIEGEGSLFWVRLPLPAAQPVPEADGETSQETLQDRPAAPPLRVLLVEDNDANRFVIGQMLRKDGHHLWDASDGQTALRLTRDTAFDLIIMDIRMPGLDGLETARRIRKTPGPARDARLIFLTAHIQSDAPERFEALGAETVLAKPLRLATLRDVLAGRLDGAMSRPGHAAALDARVIEQLRETLPPESFDDLITRFVAEGDAFMRQLDNLRMAGTQEAMTTLHQFAGSAATFGASRLQIRLGRVEDALRRTDGGDASGLIGELPAVWSETRDRLTDAIRAA